MRVPAQWRDAVAAFVKADPLTLAASVAFYSALSFAPVLVLSLWLAAHVWAGAEQHVLSQIAVVLGPQVSAVAEVVVKNADPHLFSASVAGIVSIVTLLLSSTTAFAQLQEAINRIWSVEAVDGGSVVWTWVRRRLLSFGMIAVLGFLLLITLVVNAVLAAVLTQEGSAWLVLNEGVALVVFTGAFALMLRYVPDARAPWPVALAGGAATAVLFDAGKWALGVYLAHSGSGDAYGAAGALILLLVWVYYSVVIVLVGAGVARALADGWHGAWRESAHGRPRTGAPRAARRRSKG